VSRLSMAPPLAQTAVPSVTINIGEDHILVGSWVGPSVLLRAAHVEVEVEEMDAAPTAVVQDDDQMDYDDEDEGSFLLFLMFLFNIS